MELIIICLIYTSVKYLRRYNEDTSDGQRQFRVERRRFRENITDQVSDILLEVRDDGFDYRYATTPTKGFLWESFEVSIYKPMGGYDEMDDNPTVIEFNYGEIGDTVLRLISFMITVGYKVEKTVIYHHGHVPFSIGGEVSIPPNKVMTTIKLIFE